MIDLADALRRRAHPGDGAEATALLAEAEPAARSLGMDRIAPVARPVAAAATVAAPPEAAGPVEADRVRLTRDGNTWRLDFRRRTVHLPHTKGLAQLATLVGNPGREISAVTLAGGVETTVRHPVLDDTAKRACLRRLAELDLVLDRADRSGDQDAAREAAEERAQVLAYLNRCTGRRGRVREFSDDTERARINVTRTVRQAIRQIEDAYAETGRHLRDTVRTGVRCSYRPDLEREVRAGPAVE